MFHGKPCWFELTTPKGALARTGDFYAKLFGWRIADAGMDGFTYHLASHGGDMIAGLYEAMDDTPAFWAVYFDVDDVDAAADKIAGLGGKLLHGPADIPGTGRFAVVSDPQGAVFSILQPAAMDPQPGVDTGAWNQQKESHGNWIELMSTDPEADVQALASIQVDVSGVQTGTQLTVKWLGKPVFIRRRTEDEITQGREVELNQLIDQSAENENKPGEPALDQNRTLDEAGEWLVMLGVCTHLGCVPIGDGAGDFGGWFCPCHGSHYDTAGRIRRGPAPQNLHIPVAAFVNDTTIQLG